MGLRSTRTIDVPGEDATIDVKYPSQLRMRALMAQSSAVKGRLPGESKDAAEGWELMRLVVSDCLVGWSYCDEETGEPVPVTPEAIDDLDSKTFTWLFRELSGNEKPEAKKDD